MRIAIAALVLSIGVAQAADAPKIGVTPVVRTNTTITGQRIVVPAKPDVIVATAVFPPGARLPVHRHPYPHYVYVTSGTLTVVNVETNQTYQVQAGSFVAEPMNTWHYGINNGTVPVTMLVIDQVPHGVPNNMKPKTP
ncbi:MAG TPA: cupin domain-containing protein [Rhizomicrobium sp.]|jgi:quercetin dioxygenase-like cupin family protein|nr:cupin domain-containing protein [Rhizomicrobium sp.]